MSSREQHARGQVRFYLGIAVGGIAGNNLALAERGLREAREALRKLRRLAHAS